MLRNFIRNRVFIVQGAGSVPANISKISGAFRVLTIGILGALLLAACGTASASPAQSASSSTVDKSPYVFHADLSETGQLAFLGSRQAKALQGLASYVNAQGGIDGHKIVLDIKDNQSNTVTGVAIATAWEAKKIPFIFSGSYSAVTRAVNATAGSNGPVIYDLSPVDTAQPNSYVFISGISYKLDLEAILNMLHSKGLSRIAFLNSTDASGASGWPILQSLLKKPSYSGFQVVSHQTYLPTATSATTQLAVIKSSNPQALIIWTTGTPLGTALQAQASYNMSDVPDFTSAGNAVSGEMLHFKKVLPSNIYFPTGALYLKPSELPSNLASTVSRFQSIVSKAGGHPNDGWGLAYVPAMMLISALKHLGINATAAQIKDYFQHLTNFSTIYGVYNLSSNNHSGVNLKGVYMTRWDGSGFSQASGPSGLPLGK